MKFNINKLNPGFKQFLFKTAVLIGIFILMQLITIKITKKTHLPAGFEPFYLVDIAKVLLVVGIFFFLTYRTKIFKLKEHRISLIDVSVFGLTSIFLIFVYFSLKKFVIISVYASQHVLLFAILLYLTLFLIFVYLFLAVFGLKLTEELTKEFKNKILFFLLIFIVIYFFNTEIQKMWYLLSNIVAKSVYFLLSLTNNVDYGHQNTLPVLGVGDFRVAIDKPCSGIESITIFALLYAFAASLDWKKFNKKKLLFLFLPGLLGAFFFNILRIYLLMLIGIYFSRSFALGLFHTNAGFLLFMIYFIIFWFFAYKWMKK